MRQVRIPHQYRRDAGLREREPHGQFHRAFQPALHGQIGNPLRAFQVGGVRATPGECTTWIPSIPWSLGLTRGGAGGERTDDDDAPTRPRRRVDQTLKVLLPASITRVASARIEHVEVGLY